MTDPTEYKVKAELAEKRLAEIKASHDQEIEVLREKLKLSTEELNRTRSLLDSKIEMNHDSTTRESLLRKDNEILWQIIRDKYSNED